MQAPHNRVAGSSRGHRLTLAGNRSTGNTTPHKQALQPDTETKVKSTDKPSHCKEEHARVHQIIGIYMLTHLQVIAVIPLPYSHAHTTRRSQLNIALLLPNLNAPMQLSLENSGMRASRTAAAVQGARAGGGLEVAYRSRAWQAATAVGLAGASTH